MFTIPNAANAEDVSQAQIDERDFRDIIIPAFSGTGVVSGCAVTAQASPNMTVAIAGGSVAIGGTVVGVSGGNVTIGASHASLHRFDLICVNGAGVKTVMAGTAAAQPVFPDPGGLVVLAAVRVPATVTFITSQKIVDKRVAPAATSQQLTPTGAISAFAGSAAPVGWLICDGSLISKTTYATLFSLIGNTYGAGDASNFNLPDIRGRIPVGLGTHVDVNALNKNEGAAVATRRVKHAHTNGLTLPNHAHSNSFTLPAHIHSNTFQLPNHVHAHSLLLPTHIHSNTFSLPDHVHVNTLSLPNHVHAHTFTLPDHAHAHSLTLPNHGHSVNDPGHGHGFQGNGDGSTSTGAGNSPGWPALTDHGANATAYGIDAGGTNISVQNPTSLPVVNGSVTGVTTQPSVNGGVSNPTTNPGLGGSVGLPATSPNINGAVGAPTTTPGVSGTVDNPTTNPSITGAVGNPTATPAIDGAIGNPTTTPAIPGVIGDPGLTDSAAYIVLNYIIKT